MGASAGTPRGYDGKQYEEQSEDAEAPQAAEEGTEVSRPRLAGGLWPVDSRGERVPSHDVDEVEETKPTVGQHDENSMPRVHHASNVQLRLAKPSDTDTGAPATGGASPARRALRERGREWSAMQAQDGSSPVAGRRGPGETAATRLLPASAARSTDAARGVRRLDSLRVDEVIQLFEKLGYGKYTLAVRLNGVDGAALANSTPGKLANLGISDARVRQRLHTSLALSLIHI